MGFYTPEETPGLRPAEQAVVPLKPDPSGLDIMGAAFRQDNTIVNLFRSAAAPHYDADPDHNPLEVIRGTKYEQLHQRNFVESRSINETWGIMRRIDEEEADRKVLEASGFAGFVSQVGAGMLDPTIAMPVGATVRGVRGGYSMVRSAASVGAAAGGQVTLQESMLQSAQETRTAGESALAVGSATILGGLIGSTAARLLTRAEESALVRLLDTDRAAMDAHANGTPMPAAAGAAAADERSLNLVKTGLEFTAPLSPTRRVLSVESEEARRIAVDLAETPYRFEGGEGPNGPAVDRIARMQVLGTRYQVQEELNQLYADYRFGQPDISVPNIRAEVSQFMGTAEGKMTPGDFRREVSRALQENDTHDVPQVQQAAQSIRAKVFEPWKKRAIEAGIFPEDIGKDAAESYFTRVWNKEAIRAKRPEFVTRVQEWLQSDQETKAGAKQRLEFYNAQLNSWEKQIAKLEGRFGRAEDRAARLEARAAERERDDRPQIVGMNEPDAEGHVARLQQRRATLSEEARDLAESIDLMKEIVDNSPAIPAVLKRTVEQLERKTITQRVEAARHQEAGRGAKLSERRLTALEDQLDRVETRKDLIEEYLATAQQFRNEVRAKIEAEIASWEGKSVSEAKSALKAREKYEKETGRVFGPKEGEERLAGADTAIDRTVKRILESDRDLSPEELRSRSHEIADRIISSPDGRLPYDVHKGGPAIGTDKPPQRGPLAARQFAIPNALVRDFIEDDIEQVVATYLRTVVPDVLLTERFGDAEMTAAFRKITDDYAQRIDATKSEKQAAKLGAERDAAIRDLAGIRDRIRGVFGWSADMRNAARLAAVAKNVNNLTSMGVSAISSLPDLAGIVFRHGLGTTFRDGWAPFLSHLTGGEGWSKSQRQWRAVGIAVETATAARQHLIDDVSDVYRPGTRFERGLQFATDKFFVANLLAPFTDFAKTVAANVSASEVLRAADAVLAGKATKRQLDNLRESGVDLQMAGRIAEQFKTGGETIDGVRLPNTADWKDRQAALAFEGAVARETEIAVVTPGQEKPLWMSKPVLGLLGQFKSFTASATERILIANLQRRDANVLSGMMFSMGLGMLSYKLNSVFGGRDTSDKPADWIKEGISRSGLLGWFEEGNALAGKATRGSVDVYRLVGSQKPLSRYASRNAADMLLGPTAGKLQNVFQITGAAAGGDWGESDTAALRRMMAFQNVFYVRGLLNKAEAGVNSKLGID